MPPFGETHDSVRESTAAGPEEDTALTDAITRTLGADRGTLTAGGRGVAPEAEIFSEWEDEWDGGINENSDDDVDVDAHHDRANNPDVEMLESHSMAQGHSELDAPERGPHSEADSEADSVNFWGGESPGNLFTLPRQLMAEHVDVWGQSVSSTDTEEPMATPERSDGLDSDAEASDTSDSDQDESSDDDMNESIGEEDGVGPASIELPGHR